MIRSYKTEGIVIKRRNFGELDRILTVFTKHNGKIQVKAPGVRRITSRRSSHIELLNLSILTLYKSSRSFFPIVTEAQALGEFLAIKNNLYKIGLAYYICELVDSLCPENQENINVFFQVKQILFTLCHAELNSASIISNFETKLLMQLGFLSKTYEVADKEAFIENILERKLRTRRLLTLFANA